MGITFITEAQELKCALRRERGCAASPKGTRSGDCGSFVRQSAQ